MIHLDTDKDQQTPAFQKYGPLAFPGGSGGIPRTLILDRQDKVLVEWSGKIAPEQMEKDTEKLFSGS